jgi:hypothetical protein
MKGDEFRLQSVIVGIALPRRSRVVVSPVIWQ